jgi:hypothetical protein
LIVGGWGRKGKCIVGIFGDIFVLYHVVESAGFVDGSQVHVWLSVALTVANGIACLVSIAWRIPICDRGLDRGE